MGAHSQAAAPRWQAGCSSRDTHTWLRVLLEETRVTGGGGVLKGWGPVCSPAARRQLPPGPRARPGVLRAQTSPNGAKRPSGAP